jgi:NADH dehydrogenase (ubiquinone) 1 alpha subcomplex subunit 9
MAGLTKKLTGNVVTVFNGSGFVAQNLLARLGRNGAQIVIGYRGSRYDEEKLRIVGGLGQVYYAKYHLKDDKSLYEAMKHSNIVINTIGKMNETRNFSWHDVHVDGPRRMARIARECGVEKFIHLSALNCCPNPTPHVLKNGSQFYKSKYYGELAVREEFPNAIIFRPSDIVGEKDSFINHFLAMSRTRYTYKLAIWDYYDGVTKVPVFVRDLCAGIENSLLDSSADGKTFQAVGPYRYDFYELLEYMRTCGGQSAKYDDCQITNLRWDIPMRLAHTIIERIQKYPLISWERVERDCTTDYVDPKMPTLTDLGVQLTPLEEWIRVLGFYHPREHRFEIPYESAIRLDLPKRLAAVG